MTDIDTPLSLSPGNIVPLEQAAIRRCRNGEIEGLETLYGLYADRVF